MITLDGGKSQRVVLRLGTVGTRGEHATALCALQHAGCLGIGEECQRLIKDVTSHNVGENEGVSLSVDGRADTLLTQTDAVERRLQVKWTVDDATAELARLRLGDNLQVVLRVGERLLADLLGAMDERDAWFLDAQSVTDVVDIAYLLTALCLCGNGDNSSISEEEQLLVFGNLGHTDMRQHPAGTQDARLLIQNGAQQVVGIDESLHQDIGLTILAHRHSTAGTFVLVVAVNVDGLNEPHLLPFLNGIARRGIVGTHHSHALAVAALLQKDNHVVQSLDRLHRLKYLDFQVSVDNSSLAQAVAKAQLDNTVADRWHSVDLTDTR